MSAPVDVLAVMKADFVDASITRMYDSDAEKRADRSEQAQVYVARLIEREKFREFEATHLRKMNNRLITLLASISMRCAPNDIKLEDGRTMRFVPPDPEFYWRELSNAVRGIKEQLRAINDEEDATAFAQALGRQPLTADEQAQEANLRG